MTSLMLSKSYPLSIKICNANEIGAISSFLKRCPGNIIYYTPSYQRFLEAVCQESSAVFLMAHRGQEIAGLMPMVIKEHPVYGVVANSSPFFGSHGGLLTTQQEDTETILSLMLDELKKTYPAIACCTLVENLFTPLPDKTLADKGFSIVDDRIGQCTFLPENNDNLEETLMSMFHMKTRNSLRKGLTLNQKIERRTDLENLSWLQAVHESSIKAMRGRHKDYDIFKKLIEKFPLDSSAGLYIGEVDNKPVSGLLVLYHSDTVEYFTPVVQEEYKDKQALSALIYHVMLDAVRAGYKKWNWGGTWHTQEGVYRFKNRWGAKDLPYRYFNRIYNASFLENPVEELMIAYPYFYLFKY